MRRRAALPRDPGLFARIVVAAIVTPLIVLAGLALIVAEAPIRVIAFVAIASVVGVVAAVKERGRKHSGAELSKDEAPRIHALTERLCLLADLPKPRLMLEYENQPNSWVVGTRAGGYSLHLTWGLLQTLDKHELEAVIAHELAHVANRDAGVMTVVGGPGAALEGGGLRLLRGGFWPMLVGGAVAYAIGFVAGLGTRALSRYREFAADAGAVALTGSAVALASALMKVSEGIGAIPEKDLRLAAARDTFHLLPVAAAKSGMLATHPSLQARIARLEKLERALQQR